MKRLSIASALLVLLLAGSVVNAQVLERLTGDLSQTLAQAQACAGADRWDEALRQTEDVSRAWRDHGLYLHIVTRHGDADQIQRGLETALRLLEERSTAEYVQVNTDLRVQLALLAEAEQPTLSNIL